MKDILIYRDKGASLASVDAWVSFLKNDYAVTCVNGDFLATAEWISTTTLLIIPGGRSIPFYKTLGTAGNKKIQQFVGQGGRYLGLCAGAYYAATNTIFAKHLPLELTLAGELHFYQGDAIGPVFADEDFTYDSEKGARIVNVITLDQKIYPVYFNGGCYFDHTDDPGVKIIARYEANQKPAMVSCRVGLGYAILSGVHPELCSQTIPTGEDPHHHALRQALQETDSQRKNLLEWLFKQALMPS